MSEEKAFFGDVVLTNLEHVAITKTKKGTECLMIPIADNNLNVWTADDGRKVIRLPFSAWPTTGGGQKFGSHGLKQSWPKELAQEKKNEKIYPPSLGFIKPIESSGQPAEQSAQMFDEEDDDLPF